MNQQLTLHEAIIEAKDRLISDLNTRIDLLTISDKHNKAYIEKLEHQLEKEKQKVKNLQLTKIK